MLKVSDFTFPFHFHALEKEMATRFSVLAWRIPATGGPGGLLSVESHGVGHDWSDLAAIMVLGKRGICGTFGIAASPKVHNQLKLAAGRVNPSPIVKSFLALAMKLVSKNGWLSADMFSEVVAFNNCFYSLCSLFLFVLENSKDLFF